MARSRVERRLPNSALTSAGVNDRGSRRGVRTRNRDRGTGRRLVWANSPVRSPAANQLFGLPFAIGDLAVGSAIIRYSYKPATAARRRLIDPGASRSVRFPFRSMTLGLGRPLTLSCRHAVKNASTSSVLTSCAVMEPASERKKAISVGADPFGASTSGRPDTPGTRFASGQESFVDAGQFPVVAVTPESDSFVVVHAQRKRRHGHSRERTIHLAAGAAGSSRRLAG